MALYAIAAHFNSGACYAQRALSIKESSEDQNKEDVSLDGKIQCTRKIHYKGKDAVFRITRT